MSQIYSPYKETYCCMSYSSLKPTQPTLLFLHGLGDSSLSYLSFLTAFPQYNVLIPDLLGYGKSGISDNYSFENQVAALISQIEALEKTSQFTFDNIILIPHSMANAHAMMLCQSSIQNKIRGIISIEGSITQYGSFISEEVSEIFPTGTFENWFEYFKEITIFENFIKQFPSSRSYYASLRFCSPKAFLQNALELRKICLADQGKFTNSAGNQFIQLKLPKIYFYGKNLCVESIDFLTINNLPTIFFNTGNHFLMLDCFSEFVQAVNQWVASI